MRFRFLYTSAERRLIGLDNGPIDVEVPKTEKKEQKEGQKKNPEAAEKKDGEPASIDDLVGGRRTEKIDQAQKDMDAAKAKEARINEQVAALQKNAKINREHQESVEQSNKNGNLAKDAVPMGFMLKDSSMEAKAGTEETAAAKSKETAGQRNASDVAKATKAEGVAQKAAGKEAVESRATKTV